MTEENVVPLAIFLYYFSPYSAHMIEYNGVLYPTAEHAYHCQRYDDPTIQQRIREARSPLLAWQISQTYKGQQQPDFSERKAAVMEAICAAKLTQHDDVRQALLDSDSARIVKHIVTGPLGDGFGMMARMAPVAMKPAKSGCGCVKVCVPTRPNDFRKLFTPRICYNRGIKGDCYEPI